MYDLCWKGFNCLEHGSRGKVPKVLQGQLLGKRELPWAVPGLCGQHRIAGAVSIVWGFSFNEEVGTLKER